MKKVRIGILGAGTMAKRHLTAMKNIDKLEVVGVTSARPESLERINKQFGIRAYSAQDLLLENVDAVDVCLPTFMHESITRMAAVFGVHVICEKPIALDPVDAKQMVDTCGKACIKFMVAHCLRFRSEYVFLKETVANKRYGGLVDLTAWRYGTLPGSASGNWLMDKKLSGGPGVDLHIHDVDMIRYLMGEPAEVYSGRIEKEKVISVNSAFRFDSGAMARAAAGWFISPEYPFTQGYRAVFENAIIEFHSQNRQPLTITTPDGRSRNPSIEKSDPYANQLEYFADCIRRDIEPERSSGREGMESLLLALAAGESAATGEIVRLPYNPFIEEPIADSRSE